MSIEQHVITYPGFAEGKDAKGFYTALKNAYSPPNGPYTFHILPFYEEDLDENGVEVPGADRIIHPIEEHVDAVQKYMNRLIGKITLVGKCGGARVIASLEDEYIARAESVALINIPWDKPGKNNDDVEAKKTRLEESRKRLEHRITGWGGNELPDGSWCIPRPGDVGGRYIIGERYMDENGSVDMIKECQRLAGLTKLYIVRGMNDEIITPVRMDKIPGAIAVDIEGGNHHLIGECRPRAIAVFALSGILLKK